MISEHGSIFFRCTWIHIQCWKFVFWILTSGLELWTWTKTPTFQRQSLSRHWGLAAVGAAVVGFAWHAAGDGIAGSSGKGGGESLSQVWSGQERSTGQGGRAADWVGKVFIVGDWWRYTIWSYVISRMTPQKYLNLRDSTAGIVEVHFVGKTFPLS